MSNTSEVTHLETGQNLSLWYTDGIDELETVRNVASTYLCQSGDSNAIAVWLFETDAVPFLGYLKGDEQNDNLAVIQKKKIVKTKKRMC